MEGSNEIIMNRPRREAITILIMQQNHYTMTLLESYDQQLAQGSTPIVYPQLVAAFLKLWMMIKFEYEKNTKEKYEPMLEQINKIESNISKRKEVMKSIRTLFNTIQQFLLTTGVTAFVNVKDYDPSDPAQEDRAKGL